MTRKDYIAIADSIGLEIRNAANHEHTKETKLAARNAILRTARALALPLKQDNARFDTERFMDHIVAVANGERKITT